MKNMRIKLSELKKLIKEEAISSWIKGGKKEEEKFVALVDEVYSLAQKAHDSGVTGALRILLKIQNLHYLWKSQT